MHDKSSFAAPRSVPVAFRGWVLWTLLGVVVLIPAARLTSAREPASSAVSESTVSAPPLGLSVAPARGVPPGVASSSAPVPPSTTPPPTDSPASPTDSPAIAGGPGGEGPDAETPHWLLSTLETVRPESSLGLALTFTLIGLIPGILITLTAYARIIIVLGFLRHGLALPNIPPNSVMTGLALFLTWFTMSPVVERVENEAIRPWLAGEIRVIPAAQRGLAPLREFMIGHAQARDIGLFIELSQSARPASPQDVPIRVLIPAFILSELRTAFKIGVLILLPFLLVDLVVGILVSLLALGPGVASSLGLVAKLSLFTAVDGWHLIAASLVRSFVT